jgi:DNA topoisomerase-6 subunit A
MAARKDAISKRTTAKIERLAEGVLRTVEKGKNPFLDIPVRSLANVTWSEKKRLVELGSQKQKRYFFNVSMAKKFMQTFLVSEACKELIESGKTTSIRDLYYVTKHTIGDTKQNTFEEQDESDPIIEDLEVTLDALREELHLFAARKGSMVGPITITDTGDTIDLRRMGSGGWAVPSIVEQNVITFRKHEAKYILLIEKDAVWDALQRGQVLEAQQLHHRAGRRSAAPGSAAPRAKAPQRAQASGLRAGRQRPLGLLHL